MFRNGIFVLALCSLAGCASMEPKRTVTASTDTFSLQRSQDPDKSDYELSEMDRLKLEKSFGDVLAFCQERLSGYESRSEKQAKTAFWISLSGLLAGAVISPALTAASAKGNAVWISAFSGWGGATNFVSQSYRTSGLSGSTIAQTRNDIIEKVGKQIAIASNGDNSFEERKNALMQARAECILYEIAVPSVPAG